MCYPKFLGYTPKFGVTPETPQLFGIDPNFLELKMCYPKYVGVTPDLPQISGVTPDLPQITPDFLGQPQKHPKKLGRNAQVPSTAASCRPGGRRAVSIALSPSQSAPRHLTFHTPHTLITHHVRPRLLQRMTSSCASRQRRQRRSNRYFPD